jgi:hypothetical protein
MTSIRSRRKTGWLGPIAGLLGALLVLPAVAQAHGGGHDRGQRRHAVKRHHAHHGHAVHPGVLRSLRRADRSCPRALRRPARAHRYDRFAFWRGQRACFDGRYGRYCR